MKQNRNPEANKRNSPLFRCVYVVLLCLYICFKMCVCVCVFERGDRTGKIDVKLHDTTISDRYLVTFDISTCK